MRPTRQTQPYRKGARAASPVLDAMRRGRDAYGRNPQDAARKTAKGARGGLAAQMAARRKASARRRTLRR